MNKVEVPEEVLQYLDCEVIDWDGMYMIEESEPIMANAWLQANGYDSNHLAGDVIVVLTSDDGVALHVELSKFSISELADRFKREYL